MASPLAEAITTGIAAQMNPEAKATVKAIESYVKQQQVDTELLRATAVGSIAADLISAKSNQDLPASVIKAYEKILDRLASA